MCTIDWNPIHFLRKTLLPFYPIPFYKRSTNFPSLKYHLCKICVVNIFTVICLQCVNRTLCTTVYLNLTPNSRLLMSTIALKINLELEFTRSNLLFFFFFPIKIKEKQHIISQHKVCLHFRSSIEGSFHTIRLFHSYHKIFVRFDIGDAQHRLYFHFGLVVQSSEKHEMPFSANIDQAITDNVLVVHLVRGQSTSWYEKGLELYRLILAFRKLLFHYTKFMLLAHSKMLTVEGNDIAKRIKIHYCDQIMRWGL